VHAALLLLAVANQAAAAAAACCTPAHLEHSPCLNQPLVQYLSKKNPDPTNGSDPLISQWLAGRDIHGCKSSMP